MLTINGILFCKGRNFETLKDPVLQAILSHPRVLRDFNIAISLAMKEHRMLNRCGGRPDDGERGEPEDCNTDDIRKVEAEFGITHI